MFRSIRNIKTSIFELRRLICDLSMCFNILKSFVNCYLERCFVLNRSQNRGHLHKLLYTYSGLDLRKFLFANRIIKV